jgi:hypothetical protein
VPARCWLVARRRALSAFAGLRGFVMTLRALLDVAMMPRSPSSVIV